MVNNCTQYIYALHIIVISNLFSQGGIVYYICLYICILFYKPTARYMNIDLPYESTWLYAGIDMYMSCTWMSTESCINLLTLLSKSSIT